MDPNILIEPSAWEKLKNIEAACHCLFSKGSLTIPDLPGRDVEIRSNKDLPDKVGLSFAAGQARLLHDLASIELQAMELGIRTLSEFPDAPHEFREELARVTLEEAKHFRLCLEALELLQQPWGTFPTHVGLWRCVSNDDSLLDRILIVHRYLEGAGLDASDNLLLRLKGVTRIGNVEKVVQVIATDEVAHVQFGSKWYRSICALEGIDAESDFRPRLMGLVHRIPRRLEKLNLKLREKAGFSASEVAALSELRDHWLTGSAPEGRTLGGSKSATDLR